MRSRWWGILLLLLWVAYSWVEVVQRHFSTGWLVYGVVFTVLTVVAVAVQLLR